MTRPVGDPVRGGGDGVVCVRDAGVVAALVPPRWAATLAYNRLDTLLGADFAPDRPELAQAWAAVASRAGECGEAAGTDVVTPATGGCHDNPAPVPPPVDRRTGDGDEPLPEWERELLVDPAPTV